MKLKLATCLTASLLFVIFSFAQKVKIKDGIAYVDDKEYVKVSKCGILQSECSISNLNGKELIFIHQLADPRNPGSYFQAIFIGLDTKIEVKKVMKSFVQLLYENNAINSNGELSPESVKILYEKYGNQISLK